jgi:hypothetical protein
MTITGTIQMLTRYNAWQMRRHSTQSQRYPANEDIAWLD